MNLPDSAILPNLIVPGHTRCSQHFEKRYLACRHKEQRIYADDEVRQLPDCSQLHPHYHEWQIRKVSTGQLAGYLENKKRPLTILEVGCGNGWLSHRLSLVPRSRVIGLDINFTELQQAARVFNHCSKVTFMYGDIRSGILDGREFDIIVFAASMQYFPSMDEILDLSLQYLGAGGEIHLIDTPLYAPGEVANAKKRSEWYFSSIGFREMADHYFHHSLQKLAPFQYTVMYDPSSLWHRWTNKKRRPFHWIRIHKD